MTYRVQQTDCRTGWQVVDASGKPIATYRRHCHAADHARDLNAGISWLKETGDGFTIRDRL